MEFTGHVHTCMNTLVELEEFSDITPVIRELPNVKISGIVTSPMKKFQTAYEAKGTSGSTAHTVHGNTVGRLNRMITVRGGL